jgi:hypothetical protein
MEATYKAMISGEKYASVLTPKNILEINKFAKGGEY